MRFDIADTCIREDRMRVIFESRKPLSKIASLSDRKFRRGNIKLSFAIPYVIKSSILNVVLPQLPPPPHPPPNISPMTNLVLTI